MKKLVIFDEEEYNSFILLRAHANNMANFLEKHFWTKEENGRYSLNGNDQLYLSVLVADLREAVNESTAT